MSSSGNRLEMDVMKLMMDYKVKLNEDGMKDFYVDCHGPKDMFLPQLLLYPNPSDPFNQEVAALMMRDLSVFEQTVKEYCEKYAKPEDEAVSSEEKTTDKEPSEASAHSSDETVVEKPYL